MKTSVLRFKHPPQDLGLNQKLVDGSILMHRAGNLPEDKAHVTIILQPETNVAHLNLRVKATGKKFSAPVPTLLRELSMSMLQLARVAARTGVVFKKRSPSNRAQLG